ncbi:MAG: translocation/assembly module TamB domain-containing protein [Bacteroidota bacterium]
MLRKITITLVSILAVLLGLFLIVLALLQFPVIQTKITHQLTQTLSKQLNTTVRVGGVDIDFFKTAVLEDLYIQDQQQDTLLYAGRLGVDIGIFSLLDQKIVLDLIALDDTNLLIQRNATDATFNFDFLVNHFVQPADTTMATTSSWTFGINTARLQRTRIVYDDALTNTLLRADLPFFEVAADQMDLVEQKITIANIQMNDAKIYLEQTGTDTVVATTASDSLFFPQTGWSIQVKNAQIKDTEFTFINKSAAPVVTNQLDSNHLDFAGINLEFADFTWTDDLIATTIQQIAFQEKSGFRLDKLTAKLSATPNTLLADNLNLKTPYSTIKNTTKLQMDSWQDLLDIINRVQFQTSFPQVNIGVPDLQYFAPAIEQIPFLKSQLKDKINLTGAINGRLNDLSINDLALSVGNKVQLRLGGKIQQITAAENAVFDLNIYTLNTSYNRIRRITDSLPIPEGLQEFGQFTLNGKIKGGMDSLTFQQFGLRTESQTNIQGNLRFKNLTNTDQLSFAFQIDTLRTQADDWQGFVADSLPPILDSLGLIRFAGLVEGNLRAFTLDGQLKTSIGQLNSDAQIAFNSDYTTGEYTGDVQLTNFDLARAFPQNGQLGKASLQLKGQGSGFALDELQADAKIVIDSIEYNDYTYREVAIDGQFDQRNFAGTVQFDDENAKFDFRGKANLQDSIPDFNFVLNLDTLNLQPLNFSEEPLAFRLKADIDFRGNTLNNVVGKSVISDFFVANATDAYQEDSIFFTATRPTVDSAALIFASDFVDAKVNGDFDVAKLYTVTLNYINDFFPLDNLLDTVTLNQVAAARRAQQAFDFNIQIDEPLPLTLLFVPALTELEEATLAGAFNRKKQTLDMEMMVNTLTFGNFTTDQLLLKIDGEDDRLTTNLSILDTEIGGFAAPLVMVETSLGEDSLRFQTSIAGDTLDKKLDIKGVAFDAQKWYEINLTDQFVLNGEPWKVAQNNGIYFSNNFLFFEDLIFRDKKHQIAINSEGEPVKTQGANPINLKFTNFEIADITAFLDVEDNRIEGLINGQFTLNEPFGNTHYTADLAINEFLLNQEKIGTYYLQAEQKQNSRTIELETGLRGANNQVKIAGNYQIDQQQFDIQGDLNRLEMRLLNPFTEGIISDSKGIAKGQFLLDGTPQKPDLKATLQLENTSTIIDFLGSRLLIPQHEIRIDNQTVALGNVAVEDEQGRQGTFSGQIKHEFFQNMQLDLRFDSDAFQVMNTTAEDNPLFYGLLNVDAVVDITGPLELPAIEIDARTLPNSVFNLAPLVESDKISTDDYIIFTTPEKYAEADEAANVVQYELQNVFNVDLLMELDVTTDALVRVIIDPLTGDQIEGRGRSNMIFGLTPAGDMRLFGDFILDQGAYNFSYQNLVKKNFVIQSGSRVRFPGDPLQASFDITAIYNVNTSTYDLIRNETNLEGSSELAAAQRRTEVQALLYLEGQLLQPEISFDIKLAEGAGDISSSVSRKLNDLRNDPDEMNKQVFSLLLFNSFLASENAGESLAGAGQNIALSSVSRLLSNQLNQLANKYLDGLELTFDLASYQSNFDNNNGTNVELGVGLSQKLFNDRITLKADADFNLANQQNTGQNVAGDFVLEYQLTESGSYILRVFHLSDFDILTDQNTSKTGVGINFRKAFGNVLKGVKK